MDQIQCMNINACKPAHHVVKLCHYLIIIKILRSNRNIFRPYLYLCLSVNTAVYCVQKTLCKICTCTEELHFLTRLSSRYAAADSIIIAPLNTHNFIVFILNRTCTHGNSRRITFKRLRKIWWIKNRKIRFRWRSHIFKRMQKTKIVLSNHMATVNALSGNTQRCPNRISWEQFIIWRNTCKLNHAELHNHMVDKLLSFWFCKLSFV